MTYDFLKIKRPECKAYHPSPPTQNSKIRNTVSIPMDLYPLMAWRLIWKNGNFKAFYWFRRITTMTLVVLPQEESRLLGLYNKQPVGII
jgi:hypothetical protein